MTKIVYCGNRTDFQRPWVRLGFTIVCERLCKLLHPIITRESTSSTNVFCYGLYPMKAFSSYSSSGYMSESSSVLAITITLFGGTAGMYRYSNLGSKTSHNVAWLRIDSRSGQLFLTTISFLGWLALSSPVFHYLFS